MPSNFNSKTSKSLGDLISYSKIPSGIIIQTTYGKCRVMLYGNGIFRISATLEDDFEDFSYAVIADPDHTKFEINDSDAEIVVITNSLKLIIQKYSVRFTFYNQDGKVINQDDAFGTSWIGEEVTTYKKLQPKERFIGLGEKTGNLDRRGSAYQNWNTDAFGYHTGSDPLYCTMPFYIGIHSNVCYGIFFDNPHKTFFNFGASNNRFASFAADTGEMNYYFIYDVSLAKIIEHYTHLTGRMELPPLWSIGYQQCRYSYYPDKEVLTLAQTFRDKDIPADVIVFDIHYMDQYKIFTWDSKNFPDPKGLIKKLKEQGFNTVVMCDPGIKVEPGYEPFDDGVKKNVFIKYPDGENYQGQVWPGWCHFPDFTNPETRTWWGSKFKPYIDLGISGFWNDMNEIATWGQSLPENLEFDYEGNKSTTRRGRNLYGFQMARSTYEGAKKLLNGKRPFNLTRSGYSGVQRYAAVWTGDNVSYDEHMMLGVRIVSSMGLTGIAFAGYDAGGFVGEAGTKLFARWISIATFSPFFRAHTMINTRDSEPWSYGEEVENICRNYIKFRYQILPYIYSLFYEAAETGIPLQRSMAIEYTHDDRVYNGLYQNQYLFGQSFLVAPVESNKDLVKVFLPEGEWYDIYSGKLIVGDSEIIVEAPIHKLPVFVKGGSVIPMHHSSSHTNVKHKELILHIYKGYRKSEFTFYTDDGETFSYQSGKNCKRKIVYIPDENRVIMESEIGDYETIYKTIKLVFHAFSESKFTIDQENHVLHAESFSYFAPFEKYDPFSDPDSMGEEWVKMITIPYKKNKLEITW